jgi:hypothetical protein
MLDRATAGPMDAFYDLATLSVFLGQAHAASCSEPPEVKRCAGGGDEVALHLGLSSRSVQEAPR